MAGLLQPFGWFHDLGHHLTELNRLDNSSELVARTEHGLTSRVE
jgi:hypothetical protein